MGAWSQVIGAVVAVLSTLPFAPAARTQATDRTVVVIGDLHMGDGRESPGGSSDVTEDFREHEALARLLDALRAQPGGDAVDLVINGDLFELAGPAGGGCGADGAGCTEPEALRRLERVMAAHTPALEALAAFAARGANRIHVLAGDHDAALLLPSLAAAVEQALGVGRARVAAEAVWWSGDGRVAVEHGHQWPGRTERFRQWPEPWATTDGTRTMVRPESAGTLARVLAALEPRFPILDNIVEHGVGVKYALAIDGGALPASAAPGLARALLARPAWGQFRSDLEEGISTPPEWDLDRVRALGHRVWLDAFAADDPLKPWLVAAVDTGAGGLEGVPDDELVAICDYRAAVRRSRRRMERALSQMTPTGPAVAECPRTRATTGPAFQYFWRSRDRAAVTRVDELMRLVSRSTPPALLVTGHSHLADRGYAVQVGGAEVQVLNPGAWHRTITPARFEATRAERGWSIHEALEHLRPDDLPACYGVAIVPPGSEPGRSVLRWWQHDGRGWSFADSCR